MLKKLKQLFTKPRKAEPVYPEYNSAVFLAHPLHSQRYQLWWWTNHEVDKELFRRGLVCQTSEEAKKKAEKMLEALKEVKQ